MSYSRIFSLIVVGLVSFFFIYPKIISAEIATTKDWIGLFRVGAGDLKSDTFKGCTTLNADGYCWAYTSSTAANCNRTPGIVPLLARSDSTTPAKCIFTLSSTPSDGSYVFRMYANDQQSIDALIATSKQMYVGSAAFPTPPPSAGKLYRITGDYIVDNNITAGLTGVVFVDGNLYIKKNLTNTNTKTGLVFVVQGTIYIDRTVATVNAFMITHGKRLDSSNQMVDTLPFCSAWDTTITTPPVPDNGSTTCIDDPVADNQQYLTINGSVISLNASIAPQFVRKKATAVDPAERINYEPKYLVILKDVFSRDLKIWKEVQ